MARSALFHTERSQKIAVAVMMAIILAASIGGASLFSGGPAPTASRWAGIELGPLALRIPSRWNRTTHGFRDPDRPTRQMTLSAVGISPAVPPREMLEAVLVRFLGPRQSQSLEPLLPNSGIETFSVGPLHGAKYIGQGTGPNASRTQHLLAVLTADRQQYWIVYLGDVARPNENFDELLEQNRDLFRRVVASAKLKKK